MGAFVLDMTVDERDFVKGVGNASDALDTLIDSMDDVEKESLRSTDKIEAGLKDVTSAAQDTSRAAAPIGKGFKDASKDASDGMDDLKQNAQANAKEVGASFDGSVQSIADGFQGLAAEAFEGFGPAGVVAGVAVAAGIGLATQAFEEAEEKAKQAQERVNEFGIAITESGFEAAKLDYVTENLQEIVTDSDDAIKKFSDIEAFLKRVPKLAIGAGTIASAYAGNTDAINTSIAALEQLMAAEEESGPSRSTWAAARREAIQTEIDALKGVQAETERAKQIEADYLASGGAETLAKAAAIESINAAYDGAVGSVLDFLDKESGVLNVDAYLAAVDSRKKALEDYQFALASSGFTTEQKNALEDMGIEAASALMKGYQSATPEQRKRIEDSLNEAAKSGSAVAKGSIEAAFKKPVDASVQVKLDSAAAEDKLEAIVKERTAKIKVQYVDRNGKVIP